MDLVGSSWSGGSKRKVGDEAGEKTGQEEVGHSVVRRLYQWRSVGVRRASEWH